jgi:hypothetical protein
MAEQQQEQKKIKLNERYLTESEFQQEKQRIEQMPNAQLVEVAPGEYKIKMYD